MELIKHTNLDFLNKPEHVATLLCDFYKLSHRAQYPPNTEKVYSTWTPRGSRISRINKVVTFGHQRFVRKFLVEFFNKHFFERPLGDILAEYDRIVTNCLTISNPDHSHIEALHKLGYLPLKIMAIPEGMKAPIRVPTLTVENTVAEFFWLTNYIETLFSTEVWISYTSATIAEEYRSILDKYAHKTSDIPEFVDFQGHDFSMRGHTSLESGTNSGMGHLLSFSGTDTIPAITAMEKYYDTDVERELVGTSISATEHSVMCSYGADKEFDTYHRLITEVYPTGFVSIVSDTWDLWKVLDEIVLPLKEEIMNRDGKVVIRPDSGDPVKILCGDPNAEDERAKKGVVQILWDIFGGEINSKGYKQLDSHIGAIYGDAITMDRAEAICEQLENNGFASTNVVFGIGSYTYQYNTRDTFGFAIKSSYVCVDGEERLIYKDPVTDDGTKKSLKGMVAVFLVDGRWHIMDELTEEKRDSFDNFNLHNIIFEDGNLYNQMSFSDIKNMLRFQRDYDFVEIKLTESE